MASLSQQASERAALTRINNRLRRQEEKERKRKEKREAYTAYIDSEEWRIKRIHMLELANYTCQECGNTEEELHVHHISYFNFGHEDDEDLKVLCKTCHMNFHNKRKNKYSLWQ